MASDPGVLLDETPSTNLCFPIKTPRACTSVDENEVVWVGGLSEADLNVACIFLRGYPSTYQICRYICSYPQRRVSGWSQLQRDMLCVRKSE